MTIVQSAETVVEPLPPSVGAARRWLLATLEEWGLDDMDYDLSLVISELVTNAVLHAGTEIGLRLVRDETLRLEVSDASGTLPVRRSRPAPSATTGRGLQLVDALATRWGVKKSGNGKTVWAEFAEAAGTGSSDVSGMRGRVATLRTLEPREKLTDATALLRSA
ncbi:MAG: ATP-binding protein [Acidimicrobiales bacterium]